MTDITVGSVGVDVVPNVERFAGLLRTQLNRITAQVSKEVSKTVGDALGGEVTKSLGDALSGGLPQANKVVDDLEKVGAAADDVKRRSDRASGATGILGKTFASLANIVDSLLSKAFRGAGWALGSLADGLSKVGWQSAASNVQVFGSAVAGLASNGPVIAIAAVTGAILAMTGIAALAIPIVATLGAGLAGLVSALGVGGLGAGAVGLVGFKVFSNVLSASGAYQASLTAQAKALAALQKLQVAGEFSLGFDSGNAKAPGAAAAALALAQKQGLGSKYLPKGLSASQKSAFALAQANLAAANANVAAQTKSLGPQGVAISNLWQGIQNQFAGIVQKLQPVVLPILASGLKLIGTALNYLGPVVKTVAPVITGLLNEAGKALASPQAQAFAAYIAKEAPGVIKDVGRIVGSLLAQIPGFVRGFAPIGKAILDFLAGAASHVHDFFSGNGFRLFIGYVTSAAPTVLQLLKDIGNTLLITVGALARLAPAGRVALIAVDLIVQALNIALKPALLLVTNLVSGFFLTFLQGLSGALTGLGNVLNAIHAPGGMGDVLIGAGKNVDKFANDFQTQVALITAAINGKLKPAIDGVTGVKTLTIAIDFNVLGQAYNPFTGKLYPKSAFGAPSAVSHSGGHATGVVVPVLPGGRHNPSQVIPMNTASSLSPSALSHLSQQGAPGAARTFNVVATGYGADQVAQAIVTRQRNAELLYG